MNEIIENANAAIERPIEIITEEIKFYKQHAGAAILEIGKRLNEAKSMLNHGEWEAWLEEKAEFSKETAARFMRIAKEYSNPSPVTDLGVSKALILLALPATERDDFLSEKHDVNGEEKSVTEMSKRELETAVKEKNEALKREQEANARIEKMQSEIDRHSAAEESFKRKLDAANAEIEELKANPPTIVSEAASAEQLEQMRTEIETEHAAEVEKLRKNIDELTAAKDDAHAKMLEAEKNLENEKIRMDEAVKAEKETSEKLRNKVDELNNKISVVSSQTMTAFKVHFENAQHEFNKMLSTMNQSEGDEREKLKEVINTFLNAVKDSIK